jgi:1,4-dihydroxy-2-naphthoyl-CoA synthase
MNEVLEKLPDQLADARSGEEAKEGFRAFFEKRKPSWAPEPEETREKES